MIPAIIAAMASIIGNVANVQQTRNNNALQERLVREANAASAAESQKAYERSKATNQVGLMQQAGMSKAGALNAISGGGSYTPAPVQSAQTQAPQIDLTHAFDGLVQVGENAKQRKAQEDLQKEQIKAAEEAQKRQFEENEKQRKHEVILEDTKVANQTQHDYIEYEKHKDRLKFDYANARKNWQLVDEQVKHLKKQTKFLGVQITSAELDNIRKRLENDNYPTLAKLANEKAQKEIDSLILAYNQAVENHELDKQEKELRIRFEKFTQDWRINAENMRNELETYMATAHLDMNSSYAGLFATWEIISNNYMPSLFKSK